MSQRLAVDLRLTYAEYLASPAWQALRVRTRRRDGDRCRGCGATTDLHVHHRTYERFGHEELADLVTVCQICHAFIHQEHARTGRPLAETTDELLLRIAASQRSVPVLAHVPHTPRQTSDWRQDSRGGGTWASRVRPRDEAATAQRLNGV